MDSKDSNRSNTQSWKETVGSPLSRRPRRHGEPGDARVAFSIVRWNVPWLALATGLFSGARSTGHLGQDNAVQWVDLYVNLAKPRNRAAFSFVLGRAFEVADRH